MAPAAVLVPMILTAVAGGVSAYGAVQQGRAANNEAKAQATVMEQNAEIAGRQAITEKQNADRELDAMKRTRARILGSQTAAASASGLTISGSVLDVMNDSAMESELQMQDVSYGGRMRSANAAQQSSDLRHQSLLTRVSGKNRKAAGYTSAVGQVLSTAASIGGTYKFGGGTVAFRGG